MNQKLKQRAVEEHRQAHAGAPTEGLKHWLWRHVWGPVIRFVFRIKPGQEGSIGE